MSKAGKVPVAVWRAIISSDAFMFKHIMLQLRWLSWSWFLFWFYIVECQAAG